MKCACRIISRLRWRWLVRMYKTTVTPTTCTSKNTSPRPFQNNKPTYFCRTCLIYFIKAQLLLLRNLACLAFVSICRIFVGRLLFETRSMPTIGRERNCLRRCWLRISDSTVEWRKTLVQCMFASRDQVKIDSHESCRAVSFYRSGHRTRGSGHSVCRVRNLGRVYWREENFKRCH